MRAVIVGLGNQGLKRLAVAGKDVVGIVEPDYQTAKKHLTSQIWRDDISTMPMDEFDTALVCTPDDVKYSIVSQLLKAGKHVLVEKPFLIDETGHAYLTYLMKQTGATCYTAYNHRFEPSIQRVEKLLKSGGLGKIYVCKMFYGFGTARDVKGTWRDKGMGVLSEVGSHLIDLALFWFGKDVLGPQNISVHKAAFETSVWDHITIGTTGCPMLQLEASWISWKNTFTVDIYGEKGSVHIDGLRKWGSPTYTQRLRVLPSGKPQEEVTTTLNEPDDSWEREYAHFLMMRSSLEPEKHTLDKDLIISRVLTQLHSGWSLGKIEEIKQNWESVRARSQPIEILSEDPA